MVQVQIVDNEFRQTSRQMTLPSSTNVTERIYECACELFEALWDHSPIRLLGVSTSKATAESYEQYNLFDMERTEKLSRLNQAVDSIRTPPPKAPVSPTSGAAEATSFPTKTKSSPRSLPWNCE